MSKCCVRKCNSDSRRNVEKLSFFRFPTNEDIRKKWFDVIGAKNIKPARILKICSNHFEENSVNRTLGVVRLKDNVVPTLLPNMSMSAIDPLAEGKPHTSLDTALSENEEESLTSPSRTPPKVEFSNETGNINTKTALPKNMRMKSVKVNRIYKAKLPTNGKKVVLHLPRNTGRSMMVLEAPQPGKRILKLTTQLHDSRKKIKVLNQKCRRLARKVLTYKNTIEELKKLHGS